ncbi:hypothetical protein GDV60_22180 [Pseudomonas sp. DTU12.1]|nr:hypothetical protein GDV60_22180 [Pseudomonas sp. DTU12.1]
MKKPDPKCDSALVWEPGLLAMRAPGSVSCIKVMLSQASQLPQRLACTFDPAILDVTPGQSAQMSPGCALPTPPPPTPPQVLSCLR